MVLSPLWRAGWSQISPFTSILLPPPWFGRTDLVPQRPGFAKAAKTPNMYSYWRLSGPCEISAKGGAPSRPLLSFRNNLPSQSLK